MLIMTKYGHKQYTEIQQIQQTTGAEFFKLPSKESTLPASTGCIFQWNNNLANVHQSRGLKCKKNIHVSR